MLPRENRLKKDKDLQYVYKRGRSFFTKDLGIKYVKNQFNVSRFAFIVSTKLDKRAVRRNRLKRQMSEIFRNRLKDIKKGFDLVVIARNIELSCDFKGLERNVDFILKKTKLLL